MQPPIATRVDATGLLCPMPLLKIKQALRKAQPSDIIELLFDDAASAVDVPRWLSTTEHEVLEHIAQANGGHALYVKKAP